MVLVPYVAGVMTDGRRLLAGAFVLAVVLAGCSEKEDAPLTFAAGTAGTGGSQSSSGAGGDAAHGGTAGTAVSGSAGSSAARAGTTGEAGGGNGARGGSGGRSGAGSGGMGGVASEAGAAGDAAGMAGAAGAGGSICANPLTTVDVTNLVAAEAFDTYAVTGATAPEIRASLNANREGDYDAFTTWYLSWQFTDAECDGDGLIVTVDISYGVPEWTPPDGVSPELVTHFQTYMNALMCHEYGHAKFGLDAANDVHEALSAIEAGGDCAEQQSLADAEFERILDDYIAREVQYDEDTAHGASMGAVFP
jgi:predicted secreted Zn-dependent protease